jgi:hypothetical protein
MATVCPAVIGSVSGTSNTVALLRRTDAATTPLIRTTPTVLFAPGKHCNQRTGQGPGSGLHRLGSHRNRMAHETVDGGGGADR